MFNVKIADVVIGLDNKYEYAESFYKDYVTQEENPAFTVSANEDEIQKAYDEAERKFIDCAECLCLFRHICERLINFNAFVMHSATVCVDNKAYAFAAASGTGKSTHLNLWREVLKDRLKVINGDKPIIKLNDDGFYAYGAPFMGKEFWGENISAPLKAICFIERSPENHIRKLSEGEVIGRIFNQLLMPKDEKEMDKFMSLINEMLKRVDFYLLECNMEIDAAKLSIKTMIGE